MALLNDMGPGQICRRFTVILLFLVINMFKFDVFVLCKYCRYMLAANFEFTKFSSWMLMRCKGYFMFTKTP